MKIKAFLQITFTTLALALFACSSGQSSANDNTETTTADSANTKKEVVKAKVNELSVEKLEILREAGTDVVLLDVRTPGEVADGKIPGAIEIDTRQRILRSKSMRLDGRSPISYTVLPAGEVRKPQT
jgi:hypothetical protein